MPAAREISGTPEELRRTLRDLLALSMLPAVWTHYDARQIADSILEVLVRMIGLDFAFMTFRLGDASPVEVVRTGSRSAADRTGLVRRGLAAWLDRPPPGEVIELADPLGDGSVRVAFHPVMAGEAALLVAASRRATFPSPAERLLLGVAANQVAIALRRRQAEEALQHLNETLEQRVEAEIERRLKVEDAFRQAQKMEAIGQLTGGLAHDFNNLLGAVLGNLSLLRKRLADDPASLRLIDGAIEGAERGASLTQRLLAFARRQDLKPAAVDAAETVRGVVQILQSSIGPAIELETDLDADLWAAHVDANQLELALLNLALNARDAMPDGGRLTLRARNQTVALESGEELPAGDYVHLAVADTGIGMDHTTLARATEPFFTTKGVGKGTGLGLSMVYGLAVQSGGALRLSSNPGAGTTAELWLPRAHGQPAAAMPSAAPATFRPSTILLVDDDALISMATAEMLKDLGHEVIEAPSGAKALEILRAGAAVDVVLSDQAMPGMTGLELAAAIRASWPELPVVIATGYAELPKDTGFELPRLDKPYDQAGLTAAIASATANRRREQPAVPEVCRSNRRT